MERHFSLCYISVLLYLACTSRLGTYHTPVESFATAYSSPHCQPWTYSTMAPQTMKRYVLKHRNGAEGLQLEIDAPVPEITSPHEVSPESREPRAERNVRIAHHNPLVTDLDPDQSVVAQCPGRANRPKHLPAPTPYPGEPRARLRRQWGGRSGRVWGHAVQGRRSSRADLFPRALQCELRVGVWL